MTTATITNPPTNTPAAARESGRRDRRPRRRRRSVGWIGIDLDVAEIRIAQIQHDADGCRVRTAIAISTEKVLSGTPGDFRGLGERMRKVLRSIDFRGNRCACLLPRSTYLVDGFDLPESSTLTLRDDVITQFMRRNSVSEADYLIDFWTTPVAEEKSRWVQVVAIEHAVVENFAAEIRIAGLTLECIDSPVTAASRCPRLLGPSSLKDDEPLAVVNWSDSAAVLTLVSHGIASFHRSFRASGYSECRKAVAAGFDVNPHDADVLLCRYGLPDSKQTTAQMRISTTLFGILREPLRRFRDELERTIAYLRHKPALLPPSRLLLIGDGAAMPHIDEWISDDVGLPCDRWTVPTSRSTKSDSTAIPRLALAATLSALRFEERGR